MKEFIKTNKLLVFVLVISFVVLSSYLLFSLRSTPSTLTPPVLTASPKASIAPSPVPYERLSEDTKAKLQTEADNKFGKFYEDMYRQYPWFNSLPLQADHYFVYFDANNKKVVAIIYQKKFIRGVTIESTKQDITAQLTKLGVDLGAIPIEWQIK